MSVWFCIPSAKSRAHADAALIKWRLAGYKVCVFRDAGAEPIDTADLLIHGEYMGWPRTVNFLYRSVLDLYPDTKWLVTGGDDQSPDPCLYADEIARQCTEHFKGTCGVMQPTGDPWDTDASGRSAAERICGSPWIGADFIRKWNGGRGVWCEEFKHFYADEFLKVIVDRAGLLWQRKDLTHFHDHWHRNGKGRPDYMSRCDEMWRHDQCVFESLRSRGFPVEYNRK